MNVCKPCSLAIGIAALTCQAGAQPPNDQPGELLRGLGGRIFAVEAEIVFSADPNVAVGLTFNNCYAFLEGNVWVDPLFPDFSGANPGLAGAWLQHTDLPQIEYTATVTDVLASMGGPVLTQNGTVTPARGEADAKLIAYTSLFLSDVPIIDVVSEGREISFEEASTTCPGNLSNVPL